ncbi:MAG TPA: TIGR03086 family metal-binding protein [Acidimicrobiales bacterium]|nr:TIGR03086 family metal-binding protein [Acidimicrobiales bacterium]
MADGEDDVLSRYRRVAEGFTARLADCPPDRWASPSPCTEWTAVDVARHVVDTHRRVMSTLDGSEPTPMGPEDVQDAWAAATATVQDALADEERASTVISGMFGEQPFERLVDRLLCADTLVHTWDFARATGQDERLDAGAVDAAFEFLQPIDEAMRRPGGMGPKIEPPKGADAQTRLLCFVGRAV